jgi:NADH-quinone oxidoreductase subunit C
VTATEIIEVLTRLVPGDPARVEAATSLDGMPTIVVDRASLPEIALALRDAPELAFHVLIDATGVDYLPREPRYEIIYLLLSPGVAGFGTTPARLRMRVRVPGDDPRVATVSHVWGAANWAERELYDLFGIMVDDHPDLRRILMPEDWEGFPLRRDYPVQIKQPVKTYEPLQLSEEQFVANVQAAKQRPRQE